MRGLMKPKVLFLVGDENEISSSKQLISTLQGCYFYGSQEDAMKGDEEEFSPSEIASFHHYKVTVEEIPNPNAINE